MAQWLVKFIPDPPMYEAECDGAAVRVKLADDALAYWRAAQMVRANVCRRYDDESPVFAAHADEPEAVAFAEMLNA